MVAEGGSSISTLQAASSGAGALSDNQSSSMATTSTFHPMQPVVLPTIPPPNLIAPPIAPIPLPPSAAAAAAAASLHPQVFKLPASQNVEPETKKEESNQDESGPGKDGRNGQSSCPGEFIVSEQSIQAIERQRRARQEFIMKRNAAALAVPTNDMAVRDHLRRLSEPVTLFGEREMERRDRLRMLMAKLDAEGQLDVLLKTHETAAAAHAVVVTAPDEPEEEMFSRTFYTQGSKELMDSRIYIAKYSMARAALRLQRARRRRSDPDEDMGAEIDCAIDHSKSLVLNCSEIGDDRPLSGCSFSNDGTFLATCALSGIAKVWSMPQVTLASTLKGHAGRATDIAFSPTNSHVATASADRTAKLWSRDGCILNTFEGHLDRLARVAFHPTGKYLATTSFDKTWRQWDVDTGSELLLQEGHSRGVYGIAFHPDGSLAGSCGLDSLARVWDLRTGKSILAFEGHVKPIFGINFSPNGYHLATGGEDNSCRIWDLRKRKSLYIIPAHSNLISQVKFEPQEGYFIVTASYDMTAKIWSGRDFKPVKTLSGHESKVSSLDISPDGQYIATVSHDRTIKLWSSSSCSINNDKGSILQQQ